MISLLKCIFYVLLMSLLLTDFRADAMKVQSLLASTANKDTSTCGSTLKLNGSKLTSLDSIGFWQVVKGNGTGVFDDSTVFNTMVSVGKGPNLLVWTIINKAGESRMDTITVTNNSVSTAIASKHPFGICAKGDSLFANTPLPGEIGIWESTNGTAATIVNPNSARTAVKNLALGKNFFSWTIKKGACLSTDYDIIINNMPSVAHAGNDTIVCGNSVSLKALPPTQGIGSWQIPPKPTNVDPLSSPTAFATQLKEGKNNLIWQVSNGGCDVSYDTVIITNAFSIATIQPSSKYQSTCDSIVLKAVSPPIGKTSSWSSPNPVIINPMINSSTTTVKNLIENLNYIVWIVKDPNCPASTDTAYITNNKVPLARILTPDTSICDKSYLVKARKVSAKFNAQWWLNGKMLNSASENAVINGLKEDTNRIAWIIPDYKTCKGSKDSIVIISNVPDNVYAGPDQKLCSDIVVMNAKKPGRGFSGEWRSVANNPGIVFTPSSLTFNATVSHLSKDTNVFVWYVNRLDCPGTIDTVKIFNNSLDQPFAGASVPVCGDSAHLNASSPPPGSTGMWSTSDGNINFESPMNRFSLVTNLKSGVNNLIWSITSKDCTSSDTVYISNVKPTKIDAYAEKTSCFVENHLTGSAPKAEFAIGTGQWALISQPEENKVTPASINKIQGNDSVSLAMGLNAPGPYLFSYTITTLPACSISKTVLITRNNSITATILRPSNNLDTFFVCSDSIKLAAIDAPKGGTGRWAPKNGGGTITIPDSNVTFIVGLSSNPAGSTFKWIIAAGNCNDDDEITIIRDLPSTQAYLGPLKDTSVCDVESISLKGNAINPSHIHEQGSWYYNNDKNSLSQDSNFVFTQLKLFPQRNTFKWVIKNRTCSSTSDSVTVNRFTTPVKPVFNIHDTSTCIKPMLLTVKNYTVNSVPNSLPAGYQGQHIFGNNFLINNLNPGLNTYIYETANDICKNSDTVRINFGIPPSKPLILTPDGTALCESEGISDYTLLAQKPNSGSVGLWTSTGRAKINSNETTVSPSVSLQPGMNQFIWRTQNIAYDFCVLYDTLNITVWSRPSTDEILNSSVHLIHSASGALKGRIPAIGIGTWTIISGSAKIKNVHDPASEYSELAMGKNTFVWKISNGICDTISDTIVIDRILFDVPKAFSPNGDSKNQKFIIKGVENYYPRELTIYNRWGNEVYKNTYYDNDWEGKTNGGDNLADDTYYYTLKLENRDVHTGFVVIKR